MGKLKTWLIQLSAKKTSPKRAVALNSKGHMIKRRIRSALSLILVLLVPAALLWQKHNIYDWWRLRDFKPSAQIVQLATDTTMNEKTRRLFYVYHPALEDKKTFNEHCRDDEQTIVLGCYINGEAIYLFDITDTRLSGIEEVTAAHETLHAAYARLSKKDREKVDEMTNRAFSSLNDERLNNTIALYRQQKPETVPNELHSILGTEIRSLPADLETYYKRYFTDRLKIVGYSEQYEQAFTDRKNQVAAYDQQLTTLKQQIESLQSNLLQEETELNSTNAQLNQLRNNDQIAEYNAAVPGYNAKVNAYNKNIAKLKNLINQYNDIIPKRNAIASEEQELVDAIDSREVVPPTQ